MLRGLVVALVGALLCFYGIRSVHLAVLGSGFAIGFLVGDASGQSVGPALLWGLCGAVIAWVLVSVVFRLATFFVGLATGAVVGAKLWSALGNDQTSVLLGVVVVLALAALGAELAVRFRRRALLWETALGGASIILSGLAIMWPSVLGAFAHPDDGWQQWLMLAAWLALSACGWYVQRRLFRRQLGLAPLPPKAPAAPPAA
ncbi:DUF4203 domain-containing protein [Cellulomonas alba]|uniref:DUF4203 domain-containing protein n=1 Tax=Cellulomonas alba TaxID=3053467 RepID=A0ABT7SGI7_9CELL|nr:DUF4203 domain-containing protein [Cellulomonas alba]MDM7855309.1 DUF4203 domain-containing protein [Cellulomonas alba]